MNRPYRAGILGTGSALPARVLTNHDLEKMVDTSDTWIVERTGIRERRIAEPGEATSDYGVQACQRALEAAGVAPEDVGMVICATVTPDMMFPSTASLIQYRIGAVHAGAFDLSAACTGFLYALANAVAMVESGMQRYVLVCAADLLSRITDYEDRSTCVLFGDGAGAVLVGRVPEDRGFLAFDLGSDGSGGRFLYLPAGGSRQPASAESVAARQHFIKMEGRETFKFAVKAMASSTERVLDAAGLAREDIDLLVPHQANIRIIDAARKRFGLEEEKVVVTIDRYGNTSASSIPIALDEAVRSGRARAGQLIVMVGFGGGLTWGATAVRL
ncbi:beta-ketoacyl-ACP synthase III [Alicyclobacillus macrosporangiidus]|uniref:Beta-ketoacyl-[acyl-carrier-protein] synthase III n=1 Tax=Alicyclobacillus macrosporangiidus TaxID=392015 RepID=A0A1I7H700_9BACL|nr:beta-ketoacyl-ACP synthase III [Alicyclobacillus macrosporangiidus]SFU56481.1 3-oxoacyl-[acyl-carrier-protein] synthase-3 [Alicyclobacillus macrosporangiidus]